MSKDELKREYSDRSWGYELTDDLEQALEDHYVLNASLYREEIFENIKIYSQANPEFFNLF